jgi:Glycosyl hydrolases family 43
VVRAQNTLDVQARRARRRHRPRFARVARVVAVVAVCTVALAGCFGNGVHRVGSPLTSQQMPPGLWRSLGGSECSWARVGGSAVTGTSTHTNGPQYVQIDGSDAGLTVDKCLPFWQDPGPFARPLAQPGSPFGDGDFRVGSEVAAGTYSATFPAGQRCSWANVSGFHGMEQGRNPDATRSGSSTNGFASVLISPFDYGFTSQGCGQWQPLNLPAAPGGATTSGVLVDGVAQDLPDPYTLRIDDPAQCGGGAAPCYYTFSTESGFLGLINVPVVRSSDLVHWTWAGPPNTSLLGAAGAAPGKDAMPVLAPWAQFAGNWAPSVVVRPNNPPSARYVMYYTARSKDNSAWGGKECTGVATSARVDGPYVDSANAPLICVPAAGGTIDPSPFVAADGTLSLEYADDNGIHAQNVTPDGLRLAGGEQLLLRADGGYIWEIVRAEGPSMISTPESGILLFYSVNLFTSPDYSVGVARCDTPLGPCRRLYSTPVLAKRGAMLGPGGQAPVQLPDGSWRLMFHAWDNVVGYDAGGDRTLHVLPLTFPGGNPQVG